jgi:hypothetical protein
VSGYNNEIIATSEIYTVSVIVRFVPEGQTVQLLTATVRKTVTGRNVFPFFSID